MCSVFQVSENDLFQLFTAATVRNWNERCCSMRPGAGRCQTSQARVHPVQGTHRQPLGPFAERRVHGNVPPGSEHLPFPRGLDTVSNCPPGRSASCAHSVSWELNCHPRLYLSENLRTWEPAPVARLGDSTSGHPHTREPGNLTLQLTWELRP